MYHFDMPQQFNSKKLSYYNRKYFYSALTSYELPVCL